MINGTNSIKRATTFGYVFVSCKRNSKPNRAENEFRPERYPALPHKAGVVE